MPKTNWAAYDKALKQRGNINFWISDDAIKSWAAKPTGKRGRQPDYSDLAIETTLSLRLVFKQGLRQIEGFMESIFKLMELDLQVPDHTTLSRRGQTIDILPSVIGNSNESLTVIIDSTGLKIYGAGEWSETKHGISKRREWRKLHLSIDGSTLEIIGSSLTDNHVGDITEVPELFTQIEKPINEVMGDGAYDSKKIYEAAYNHSKKEPQVTVPPKKNGVLSAGFLETPTERDRHIDFINKNSRKAWDHKNTYYRRLLVENAMGRFKGIIGAKLRSINLFSQKIEAKIGCKILNKMVSLGTPLHPNLVTI